jgi:hypothetical protein
MASPHGNSIGIDEEERKKRLEEIRKMREKTAEQRRLIEMQALADQSYR